MNELKTFQNKEFGEIRTVEVDGKILFCGKDVAIALGYSDTVNAIKAHCREDGVAICHLTDNLGRDQQAKFISEGNVYRLICGSKLPSAENFERWVFDEVLPAIRSGGGYVNDDELFLRTYLPQADEQTKLLFKTTLATMKNLNAQIEASKPKVIFADAVAASGNVILVGELAKILKGNGCEMGQKRLFERLRNEGYLIKRDGLDRNMPTQRSMELGLFKIKETAITHSDGHVTISKTTLVTGKGQEYFVNRFSDKAG